MTRPDYCVTQHHARDGLVFGVRDACAKAAVSGRSSCPERKGNFAGRHRPRESSGLAPYRGLANARIRSCDMRRPVRLSGSRNRPRSQQRTRAEEFDERRRNSDEESRAADPDNGNFFIDKVVCVKVDAAGNQWSTSRLPVSTIILSFDALTSPCTITIPPIATTTNDSQSVSQRTIEWTLAGPHTRG